MDNQIIKESYWAFQVCVLILFALVKFEIVLQKTAATQAIKEMTKLYDNFQTKTY